MTLAVAALAALGALAAPAVAAEPEPDYVGVATMLPDGTIHMRLRGQLPGGGVAEGEVDYQPDSPDYQQVLEHLGGLKPGETKLMKPWPDDPAQKH